MAIANEHRPIVDFAAQLGVTVSEADLFEDLESAPDYGSLLGVVSALESWGVAVDGMQMSTEHLAELKPPALLSMGAGALGLVKQIRPGASVTLEAPEGAMTIPWADLSARWDGVVLVPDATKPPTPRTPKTTGEPTRVLLERMALVVAGSALAVALGLATVASAQPLVTGVYALLAVVGLGLSVGLSREELGVGSFMSALCRGGGTFSCQSVLSSKAAKLGPVSMADVGVAYFAGIVMLLATQAAHVDGFASALWLLALSALPYTVFSVVYQGVVLRQWCPLCLGVQGVLVAQAVALSLGHHAEPLTTVTAATSALAAMVAPGVAWVLVKPAVAAARKTPALQASQARLERNPLVVQALLAASDDGALPSVPLELVHEPTKPPVIEVTAYTDPACPHCFTLHHHLDGLLARAGDAVRLRWRYVDVLRAPTSAAFFERLATLHAAGKDDEARSWAHAWFEAARLKAPSPTTAESLSPEGRALLERQQAVLNEQPIRSVPALVVNGKLWPAALRHETLIAFAAALKSERDEAATQTADDETD